MFGRAETTDIHLEANMWNSEHKISQDENEWLTRPFTLNELDNAVKEIKGNTALGPDGFTIEFFKTFWSYIREDIKEMLDQLYQGNLDLWRLNYGVIILLPKVKPATNIKQFRPICSTEYRRQSSEGYPTKVN